MNIVVIDDKYDMIYINKIHIILLFLSEMRLSLRSLISLNKF